MKVSDEVLAQIAERLKALADPTRLKLLHSLEAGELCVGDLVSRVESTQANVSKHLALLRKAGLVATRREGLNVFYRAADETAFTICRTVCEALERRLDADRKALRQARRR